MCTYTLLPPTLVSLQLRHPSVLTFKDTVEVEERGETVIYLMTESVTPAAEVIKTVNVKGPERSVPCF